MSKKVKLGMIGGGSNSFIGILHRNAAASTELYQLVGGVFSSDFKGAQQFGRNLGLDKSRLYKDVDAFIKGENALPEGDRIEAVSILTPNNIHFEAVSKLIKAGFNIICEKPITIDSKEAVALEKLSKKHDTVFGVTHTYTGYPMVREMKALIAQGVLGDIQRVDVQYYQGWINPIIHNANLRKTIWRLDPKVAGISSCMGDIGVHAFNMVEYTTGLKVKKVLADLNTLYKDNKLDIDGTVLLRLENNIRGVIRSSQIATGEENTLTVAIYGRKGSLKWEQENPNYLQFLRQGEPAQTLKPVYDYNSKLAGISSNLQAPGHPEGITEAMGNIYAGVAKAIRGHKVLPGEYPTINEGVRGMKFIEATVKSNKAKQTWEKI
ncbi:MAG: Gfo/Idh/MocA family oxidoreductase [Flavobacteriales bacterium]|nr:Gfo/Idh/MocA family oxidoreductase [Flavobacteriales bacterium]